MSFLRAFLIYGLFIEEYHTTVVFLLQKVISLTYSFIYRNKIIHVKLGALPFIFNFQIFTRSSTFTIQEKDKNNRISATQTLQCVFNNIFLL